MRNPRPLPSLIRVWRTNVVLADFLAAGTVALVTAVLALVVEDVLPAKDTVTFNPWRWLALAGALLLLGTTVRHRNTAYRNTGTLFYVRTLDFKMRDWHEEALNLARGHRMSLRSVTPWVDLSPAENGVVDLVGTCAAISASLNTLINTDRDDTGYAVAPNMLWPIALAVGFGMPTVSGLQLLELDGPGAASGGESLEVTWVLADAPPGPGVVERTLTTTRHVIDNPAAGAARVGLILAFTKHAADMDLLATFGPFGVSEYYLVRACDTHPDLDNLTAVRYDADRLTRLAQVLPHELARIKTEIGDRELVVTTALPKTLTLALGWGLSQVSCAFFPGTHLALFNGQGKPFLPVRVHSSQPPHNPTTAPTTE